MGGIDTSLSPRFQDINARRSRTPKQIESSPILRRYHSKYPNEVECLLSTDQRVVEFRASLKEEGIIAAYPWPYRAIRLFGIDELVFVHATKILPLDDQLKPSAERRHLHPVNLKTGEEAEFRFPRETLHFSINGVNQQMYSNWRAYPFCLIYRGRDIIDQIISLSPDDTMVVGSLDVNNAASVIENPSGADLRERVKQEVVKLGCLPFGLGCHEGHFRFADSMNRMWSQGFLSFAKIWQSSDFDDFLIYRDPDSLHMLVASLEYAWNHLMTDDNDYGWIGVLSREAIEARIVAGLEKFSPKYMNHDNHFFRQAFSNIRVWCKFFLSLYVDTEAYEKMRLKIGRGDFDVNKYNLLDEMIERVNCLRV